MTGPTPPDAPARRPRWDHLGAALIPIITLAVFWRTIPLPFIQDDWGHIVSFKLHRPLALVAHFLDPRHRIFYRPAAWTYLLAVFTIFGGRAWVFHLLALLAHGLNAWLTARLVTTLTRERRLGLCAGLLYAAAVAIHLDTLLWAVGIYDVGAAFFALATLNLFLAGRTGWSAASFLLGTLFKDPVLVLPPLLAVLEFSRKPGAPRERARRAGLCVLPHAALVLLLVAAKLVVGGRSPAALPTHHPYYVALTGPHIAGNLLRYAAWLFQALVPLGEAHRIPAAWMVGLLAIGIGLVMLRGPTDRRRILSTLVFWMLLSFLPFVFLPNHTYRYYALYALPAFLALVLVVVRDLLIMMGLRQGWQPIMGGLVTASLLLSTVQSARLFKEGPAPSILADGTNLLIQRACTVNLVRTQLRHYVERPEDGAVILLDGVELWSFNKDSGPQAWYTNFTLRTYYLKDLRVDEAGLFLDSPVRTQVEDYLGRTDRERVAIDPEQVYAFRLAGLELQTIGREELLATAQRQSRIAAP